MKRIGKWWSEKILSSNKVRVAIYLIISIVLLAFYEMLLFIDFSTVGEKILATCAAGAICGLPMVICFPTRKGTVGFRDVGPKSFLTWCILVPFVIGWMVTAALYFFVSGFSMEKKGFWVFAASLALFSMAWFVDKLSQIENHTLRLDLYSTVLIAVMTILTTLFDLGREKNTFVILLAFYFFLQILVKGKQCKVVEAVSDNND